MPLSTDNSMNKAVQYGLVRGLKAGYPDLNIVPLLPVSCGKKATTPRSPLASGPSSLNIDEASEGSIVLERLLLCLVSTPVQPTVIPLVLMYDHSE